MIDKNQYHDYIEEFIDLYSKRPFKVNSNGMRFNHSFGIFYILKTKRPKLVIESGVDKGHSTWLIENTIDTEIVCIDPNLTILFTRQKMEFISKMILSE